MSNDGQPAQHAKDIRPRITATSIDLIVLPLDHDALKLWMPVTYKTIYQPIYSHSDQSKCKEGFSCEGSDADT